MIRTMMRLRTAPPPSQALWHSVPLELALSALAIVVAAGLKLAGLMP